MCVNCNDSLQVNLPIGPAGANGANGQSAYLYIASASNTTGTANFTYPAVLDPPNTLPGRFYLGLLNSTTPIVAPVQADFTTAGVVFNRVVGANGAAGAAGAAGTNGTDGLNGAISAEYYWDSSPTAPASPTYLKTNNVNPALATQLYVSFTDLASNNIQALLALAWSSTSSTKSVIVITKKNNPNQYISYEVTANGVNGGTYWIFFVNYVSSSAGFSATTNTEMVFSFSIVGDKGATGTTGPAGPTGATGLPGNANLTRPGSNTSYIIDNYMLTDQGITPTNYFQYSAATGTPTSGTFKCFDNTGAVTAVKSDVTMIRISVEDVGAVDYSSVMSGIATNGTITFDNTTGSTASYDIIDAVYTIGSPGYLTLYVAYNTGAGSFLAGLSGHYDVSLASQYSLTLANQNYNRILLNNIGGSAGPVDQNLIVLRAPQAATVGTLMVVEVGAAGGTNDLYITYGYNESGVTNAYQSTLSVQVDYTKSTSHNNAYAASSPISIKLDTGGQSALLQFYVVASNASPYRKSLAFIGGNIYSR